MALTAQSELYGSVTEDGFNRFVDHIMRKRPSLFNYGTAWVAANWRRRLCEPPDVAPEVIKHGNPVVTVEDPVPLLGTNGAYGLNFAVQLRKLRLDLHPQSAALPAELGMLAEQRFALVAQVCAGLGCPSDRALEQFPPAPLPPFRPVTGDDRPDDRPDDRQPPRPERVITLPTDRLQCCCLELHIVGHFVRTGPPGAEVLEPKLDGLEIVDIRPDCLEANLECYIRMLMHFVLLPRLRMALPVFTFGILDGLANVTLKPSTTVPHNPAVEDDQIKVYVDMEVAP
jgi:hypothetical protein